MSSYQLGLIKRACDSSRGRVSCRGLNRRRVQCTALGRRPQNRHSQNGKVKLFSADRGHHVPAPKGGMSGWLCLVCVSLLCLLVALVGRSWSPDPCRSWLFPWSSPVSSGVFLRYVLSGQGRRPRKPNISNQVRSGTYCSGGCWAVVVHYCCGSGRVDMAVYETVEQGSCDFRLS